MSLIRINVTDQHTVVTGELHGSDGDRLVASLTAEPETIGELETAFKRFARDDSDSLPFGFFRKSELEDPDGFLDELNLEPYDAGILIIDLAGRTIASESTYSAISRDGTIGVADRLSEQQTVREFGLPYRLSPEWKFITSVPEFQGSAQKRRKTRMARTPIDMRPVLFGEPMVSFIAEQMTKSQIPENAQLRAHIHSIWLLKERDDLNSGTPRDVLLEKHDFISADMHSRSLQWSFTKDAPPDLPKDSAAYKYAGFGTHEIVVYYDLMRYLLEVYSQRLRERPGITVEEGIEFLSGARDAWLEEPNADYSGRFPSEIIEFERIRRNITMSPHECLIDEDCPICVEMSQIFDTPMFWHLDGSHMDREFAFSFHKTYEEWQQEELAFEAFMKRESQAAEFESFAEVEEYFKDLNLGKG